MRFIVLFVYQLWSCVVLATPEAGLIEKQKLLGVSNNSYYVIATETEIQGTYFSSLQRVLLKQYDLQSNATIDEWLLSSIRVNRDPETLAKTLQPDSEPTTPLAQVLGTNSISFAGALTTPAKEFLSDSDGMYLDKSGLPHYVLSSTEIAVRIPDYIKLQEHEFLRPKIIGIYTEWAGGRKRYFLVARTSDLNSGYDSELVLSLPE